MQAAEDERKARADKLQEYLSAEGDLIDVLLTRANEEQDFVKVQSLLKLKAKNQVNTAYPDLYSGLMQGDSAAIARAMAKITAGAAAYASEAKATHQKALESKPGYDILMQGQDILNNGGRQAIGDVLAGGDKSKKRGEQPCEESCK